MEYQIIKTKFGKNSIYVPSEKMLYVSEGRENEFICYQTVLSNRKKKGHENRNACNARIRCLRNGKCERQNFRAKRKVRVPNKQPVYAINIRETLFHENEPWNFNKFGYGHSIIHGRQQELYILFTLQRQRS